MLGSPDSGVPVLQTAEAKRRRVYMPILIVSLVAAVAVLLSLTGRSAEQLVGSGSTLAQPLVEWAAKDFRNKATADNPQRRGQTGTDWVVDGSGIDYEPIGSLGGIMRLRSGNVDFAVSDYPLSAEALADGKLAQFPLAVGAIAMVHSLDLGDQRLRLDAETVAAIYLGEITSWDDRRLTALNPQANLPSLPIVPVHRSDGSGSTFGFTGYLASFSNDWQTGPGVGSTVQWPADIGVGVERSAGVLAELSRTPGAIGYVEQGQAVRAGLGTADLANQAGQMVAATHEAMAAALDGADWSGASDYVEPLTTGANPDAYPMTVAIYAIMKREQSSTTRQVLSFLSFVIDEYDSSATDLGYLPLPASAAEAVKAYWLPTFDYTAV